jgi:hypothetical protein
MDASQLWYPERVHSGPKYEFCTFNMSNVSEMLRNTRKHYFGSNGLEWMLHNFGTPKYYLRARNTSFFIFYLPRVCEMLRNTSKHHFGSNVLEWMLHNFGTPKYCIRAWNTSILSFTCQGFAKCSETLPNIILGPMDLNGCFTTLVPRNSAFRLEQKFCILFVPKDSGIIWNTHKHHFGTNGLEWMLHNFGTPK